MADLSASYVAISPVGLYAGINAWYALPLSANLNSVPPVHLSGYIKAGLFYDLDASASGFADSIIGASINGNSVHSLYSSLSGIAHGQVDLYSELNTDDLDRLFCSITGTISGSQVLQSIIEAIPPHSLSGYYQAVGPVDLNSSISGQPPPVSLGATFTGVLGMDHLGASINSTGGFVDIPSFVRGGYTDANYFSASIDGASGRSLSATLNTDPQASLFGQISASGPFGQEGVGARIEPIFSEDLSASWSGIDPPKLMASYFANPGSVLYATIFPDVFFIDALIPLNTFQASSLNAVINTDTCDFKSGFKDLEASIYAIHKLDLSARIIGAEQFVKASDLIKINFSKLTATKDKHLLNIDPAALATDYFPIVLVNFPFGDLTASIVGIQASSDLSAEISPRIFSSFISSDPSTGLWVNPKTGERKIIRFLFTISGKSYYYSEVAHKTFPETIKDSIKLVVETYSPIEEDPDEGPTELAVKENVRRCIISDLTPFNTWDDAVKYGIKCAAGLFDSLHASINALNTKQDLKAKYTSIDDEFEPLFAKISPTFNDPVISGSIVGTGGFVDVPGFIRSTVSDHTKGPITASGLVETLQPVMVTYSGGDPQIVLQPVKKSGIILPSIVPDLTAEIVGLDQFDLVVTITGTP